MRTLILYVLLFLAMDATARSGQIAERIEKLRAGGGRFKPVELFRAADRSEGLWKTALKEATLLRLDPRMLRTVTNDRNGLISMAVPFEGGVLQLDLAPARLWADDVRIVAASGAQTQGALGVHYRGMVRGVPGSWAAISVQGDQVMGLINDGRGQVVLGPLERDAEARYVAYREQDLRWRPALTCGTVDQGVPYRREELEEGGHDRTVRCVRYYWEVDHNVFQGRGSMASTVTFATGIFNQSAALFDNDGIDIVLSELFVWDVPSPYTGPSSQNYLVQFGTHRTSFNGDMAHLISYGGGGGVAWVNTICGSTNLRMAYSGIHSSYSTVPTYSWSVQVTTHEAGHNLGSNHTHACVWNGNGTRIDGCGPASGYNEGSCAAAPIPTGTGGTIMSYCHLITGVGINFNIGFGPQPAAVIRNRVNAATCLSACGTTCDAPHDLGVNMLATTSATLRWANIGAASYTVQWRQVGASSWNIVSGITANTLPITGLVSNTGYEFQVSAICTTGSSGWAAVFNFTTPQPCPDVLEPNNTLATSALVTLPATVNALIATASDVDHYRFTITSGSTINVNLTGLFANYDIRLLNSAGTTLAASLNSGINAEYLNYMGATPGTYHVQVVGVSGAFQPDMCYALFISTYPSECLAPPGLAAGNITHESATITWGSPSPGGNSAFDLRWKESGSGTWVDVPGIGANTHQLSGLLPLTFYQVQVRRVCGGGTLQGNVSRYGDTLTFNTMDVPCEVSPPIRVAIKVLLDGPYNAPAGLMYDTLRYAGLLPINEPYSALGYVLEGPTSTTQAVFAVTGVNAIVDWLLVELRSNSAPYPVFETKAALLQRDGDVVGVDGTSPVGFCAPGGELYRIGIRHRNHLGCVTGVGVTLGSAPVAVDLSGGTATYGTAALRVRSGVSLLWAGNAHRDNMVRYTGVDNDRDAVLMTIGGTVPTNTVPGYRLEDLNLDGKVKYTGANNDRDLILQTVGGSIPTNSVLQQMP